MRLCFAMLATIFCTTTSATDNSATRPGPVTTVQIQNGRWLFNQRPTNPNSPAAGLLMNVRMVNATFEDTNRPEFDSQALTRRFCQQIPHYAALGVNAFTLNLQGGMPGYENARNSAFNPDGSLRTEYLRRVEQVIRACDQQGIAVILGLFYQRQAHILQDDQAIENAVVQAIRWVQSLGLRNVLIEIANEYPHNGFKQPQIRTAAGQIELLQLARHTAPELLLTTSGYGNGQIHPDVAAACDFLTPHWNNTPLSKLAASVAELRRFNKPIVCNEDDRTGIDAVKALHTSLRLGCSYGLMLKEHNQTFPFHFDGYSDAPEFYSALQLATGRRLQTAAEKSAVLFPPPASAGGWPRLQTPAEIREIGGMDPTKLAALEQWLLASDQRPFAAVVIRRGKVVLQTERGNNAATDSRRVASVSKAICATVLAIASERSLDGLTPRQMTFADPAFKFIPQADPLSDPRKSQITVRQLLNHTSGICPESLGAPNDGTWEYVLGQSGDSRTARLAFDPGTACGYSTHAFAHAALACENITGQSFDLFTIQSLFQPLGIEHYWFQTWPDSSGKKRPSHGIGLPALELARIGYCMLHNGRWRDQQVIPAWFVEQTGRSSHSVTAPELRWQLNPAVFTLGWELPARHFEHSGRYQPGIPADARCKPGSGGQILAFVPSLDLVIARQTGGSGPWPAEEFLARTCAAVISNSP
ncbi:MAG: serine hydrolase [Planctomycetaceae bacterium]